MLDSFAAKAVQGLHRFFKLLLVVAHFLDGRQKEYFYPATVVNEDS
jgi:hypothetical protein